LLKRLETDLHTSVTAGQSDLQGSLQGNTSQRRTVVFFFHAG